MSTLETNYWKKCSTCKKEIAFSAKYFLCSVSTCRHSRKGFRFCSVPCWDAHLGYANHRESWAEEVQSPSKDQYLKDQSSDFKANNTTPQGQSLTKEVKAIPNSESEIDKETLVVVSKVKKLIQQKAGFNTSQCCIDALTRVVQRECIKASANAEKAGRKTVMGKDFEV